jgi:hypothetical protein
MPYTDYITKILGLEDAIILAYKKNLTTAMLIIPTITVSDRFFLKRAVRNVGMIAARTVQSTFTASPSLTIKLLTINAVKMHTGINESHFVTNAGILKFRTKMYGTTLGINVTIAHPKITRKIEKFILICLSALQMSLQ